MKTENFVLSLFRVGEGNEFLEEKLWRQKRFYKSKKIPPEIIPPVVFVSFSNSNQIKHYHPRSNPAFCSARDWAMRAAFHNYQTSRQILFVIFLTDRYIASS